MVLAQSPLLFGDEDDFLQNCEIWNEVKVSKSFQIMATSFKASFKEYFEKFGICNQDYLGSSVATKASLLESFEKSKYKAPKGNGILNELIFINILLNENDGCY